MFRNPWEIDWNNPAQAQQQPAQAPLIQRPREAPMQTAPQAEGDVLSNTRRRQEIDMAPLQQQGQTLQNEQRRRELGQVPEGVARDMTQNLDTFNALRRAAQGFQDNYSGFGSGIENTLQGYLGTGTPGQREWWADFQTVDNAIRNQLFGATLTPGERQVYADTSITPNMAPRQIRANLNRRLELARSNLRRRVGFLRANGYNENAINALIGDSLAPPQNETAQNRQGQQPGGPYWERDQQSGEDVLQIGEDRAPPTAGPGLLSQLGGSMVNTLAGVGQGAASLLDIPTRALGQVLGTASDIIPGVPEWVSDELRNPFTIGGAIEQAAPTPDDMTGRGVRLAANLTGGAAAFPRALSGAIANRFGGMAPTPPPGPLARPASQIMDDATRARVPMMPADVGGPTTRMLTAATAQTPGGAAPIVNAGQRTLNAAGTELGRIARGFGAPSNAEAAGEAATRGALSFRSSSRDAVSQLYDRAIRAAGDTRVVPTRAIATLDRNIAELSESPVADDAVGVLTNLRETLQTRFPNGVTVAGIRGMRTQLRDRFFREGLRGTDTERRVMQVVDEASNDMADALTAAGRSRAADAFRAADAAHAARVRTIDEVIMPIIGRRGEKSGTQVFQSLNAAAQGNGRRLSQFLRSLPEEDRGEVQATLINSLGRASSGQQGPEGATFSLNQFLTHWNNLTPAARNALFPGESREAINRLARIADHTKAAGRYANSSRTGGVVMTGATFGTAFASLPAMGLTLMGQYAAGRLLSSPAVARALASVGSARSAQQAAAAVRQLGRGAARNPALAGEIGDLQRRLTEALSASPALRAAAEEDRDVR